MKIRISRYNEFIITKFKDILFKIDIILRKKFKYRKLI